MGQKSRDGGIWMSTRAAADYLGVSYPVMRNIIIPEMIELSITGFFKSGKGGRTSNWRFTKAALDRYVWLCNHSHQKVVVAKRRDIVLEKAQSLEVSKRSARPYK